MTPAVLPAHFLACVPINNITELKYSKCVETKPKPYRYLKLTLKRSVFEIFCFWY